MTKLGFPHKTIKSTHLISFYEHSWLEENKLNNVNSLFELSLFQNSIKNSRPFDNVFIYKNTNEGILNFGNYWNTDDLIFHQSRYSQLISFISTSDITSRINKDPLMWARTFGGVYFYNDIDEIYKLQSTKTSELLINSLVKQDGGLWSTDITDDISEKLTQGFEKTTIFNKVKSNLSSNFKFKNLETYDAWNWFSLSRIKLFFEDNIKNLIINIKDSKIEFIRDSYCKITKEIENNSVLLINQLDNSDFLSPQLIFDTQFKTKSFSIASLKTSLKLFTDKIEKRRDDFYDYYKSGYKYEQKIYIPFELDSSQNENLSILSDKFKDKDDKFLNEEEQRLLENLETISKKIPHPISFFIKSFFLSTLLVMMVFNLLLNFINGETYSLILFYSFLTVLFVIPFVLNWNKYKMKLVG